MNSPFSLTSKYNTIAAIVAGTILASIVISFLLIRPAWSRLGQLGREIPTENQKRDDLKIELDSLQKAKTYFSGHGNDVEQVNIAVPTDPQIPEVLLIIEDLAKQNSVRLTSFVPQNLVATSAQTGSAGGNQTGTVSTGGINPGGTQAVEVTANFEGSYASLINFFYTVEKSLRIIDVKNITVANGGQAGGQQGSQSNVNVMSGSMTFKAYYKAVTQATGTGTTAAPSSGGSK